MYYLDSALFLNTNLKIFLHLHAYSEMILTHFSEDVEKL